MRKRGLFVSMFLAVALGWFLFSNAQAEITRAQMRAGYGDPALNPIMKRTVTSTKSYTDSAYSQSAIIESGIYSGLRIDVPHTTRFEWFEDFTEVLDATNEYELTTVESDSGDATEAIQDAQFGVLKLVNDTKDNDHQSLQTKYEIFKIVASKRTVVAARFKISDATQTDAMIGISIRDTSPLDASDGVWFIKDDGLTSWDFQAVDGSSITSVNEVAAADTSWHIFSIVCDGDTSCTPYIDGTAGTAISSGIDTGSELCFTAHIQNGAVNAAKSLELDWLYVSQER